MKSFVSRAVSIAFAAAACCSGPVAFAQSAPAGTCADCGRVQAVRQIEDKGKTSGVGAVAGGVLGGVIGHQIGGGTGRTVATIAGAGGGAYVGNKVEQNRNTKTRWEVTLKMDNGNTRTFHYSNPPTVHEGERVKLVDGGKRLALLAN